MGIKDQLTAEQFKVLGIGAKSVVDEQEQAALDELAAMLDMSVG
jgi:hypothetical protein